MSTKYSMEVLDAETDNWEGIALFSDLFTRDALTKIGRATWEQLEGAASLTITDMETGEVMFDVGDDTMPDPYEDWGFNEDMGYDPYMGCYTDDC